MQGEHVLGMSHSAYQGGILPHQNLKYVLTWHTQSLPERYSCRVANLLHKKQPYRQGRQSHPGRERSGSKPVSIEMSCGVVGTIADA